MFWLISRDWLEIWENKYKEDQEWVKIKVIYFQINFIIKFWSNIDFSLKKYFQFKRIIFYYKLGMIKGLSIESYNVVIGMWLWRILGIEDNLLGPSLSQNRRWEDIQWIFSCARSLSHLCLTVYARARTRDLWRQDGEGFTRGYGLVSLGIIILQQKIILMIQESIILLKIKMFILLLAYLDQIQISCLTKLILILRFLK